jgi:predicted HTH domain antitoxin
MKVNSEMKVKEVLKINERMIDAFGWLAPEFERLRNPILLKAMAGRVSVEQAARIAKVPLSEVLYLLNLAAGEDEQKLTDELRLINPEGRRYTPQNTTPKPGELDSLQDDDPRIHFVDVLPQAEEDLDPRPAIMHGLSELRDADEVLLVRHRFDPIPLRDLFVRRGFSSWAEERRRNEWYIYFYRPGVRTAAVVHPPMSVASFFQTASAGR